MTSDGVTELIEKAESIVLFQVSNGLITLAQAEGIFDETRNARQELEANHGPAAARAALHAYATTVEILNRGRTRTRLLFLYGLHVWVFIALLAAVLIWLLYVRWLGNLSFVNIPGDVILWGGLGGCAYSIYYMRRNVFQYQLSKYYTVYWFVYPVAGIIFGLGTAAAFATGALALSATPSYTWFAGVSFLAGLLQQWAIGTLQDIANAIHEPKSP